MFTPTSLFAIPLPRASRRRLSQSRALFSIFCPQTVLRARRYCRTFTNTLWQTANTYTIPVTVVNRADTQPAGTSTSTVL